MNNNERMVKLLLQYGANIGDVIGMRSTPQIQHMVNEKLQLQREPSRRIMRQYVQQLSFVPESYYHSSFPGGDVYRRGKQDIEEMIRVEKPHKYNLRSPKKSIKK
jgi:hypothetical protein